MKRKILIGFTLLLSIGTLASCTNGTSTSQQPTTSTPSTELPPDTSNTSVILPSSSYPEDVFSITSFGDAYTGATIPLACRIDGGLLAPEDQLGTVYTITEGSELATIENQRYVTFKDTAGSITIEGTLEKEDKTYTAELQLDIKDFTEGALTVAEVKEQEVGSTILASGVVTAFVGSFSGGRNGLYLSDETQTIYVYGYETAEQVERGDEVVISGTISEYNGCLQITSPSLERKRDGDGTYPDPSAYISNSEPIKISELKAMNDIAGQTFKLTGKIETYHGQGNEGSYTNYNFTQGSSENDRISIYSSAGSYDCPENEWLDEYIGTDVTVAFYINSKNSSGKWRGNIIYIFEG